MAAEGRNVLIALDDSGNAKTAFEWALKNLVHSGDTVLACHVTEPPTLPTLSLKEGLALPAAEWQKTLQETMKKAEKLYNDYEQELITRKIKYKLCEQTDKKPGHGIIHVAEQNKADIIVIGTRGLDSIRRTFLGSVSDYVIHHSHVPVVVVPKN